MSMFSNLNQVVLNEILVNLQEGNINVCRNYGFSKQELQEIEKLSTEEVYELANTKAPFAKVEINHDAFWRLVARVRRCIHPNAQFLLRLNHFKSICSS